jgi:hypothetical protein
MTLNEHDFVLFKKWLKSQLAQGAVTVTFTKKDGTERVMECTTSSSIVPPTPITEVHVTNTDNPIDFPKVKKVNEEIMPVYDIGVKGWRSFRWDSIKNIKITIGENLEYFKQTQ